MNEEVFWEKRSRKYNNLKWVNDMSYLDAFTEAGDFKKSDVVLDVGTGTGVVAHKISSLVRQVIGLDISQDMLKHSNWNGNMYFIRRDVRDAIFCDGVFDRITSRMVFHHIIDGTQNAMNECYRILKKDGKMILAEGVPPSPEVKDEYEKIFKLKEKRLTFLEDDLLKLMGNAGFSSIDIIVHTMENFSVKNWLDNSGNIDASVKKKIYDMHVNASDEFKRAYEMRITKDDCIIKTKSLILVGEK